MSKIQHDLINVTLTLELQIAQLQKVSPALLDAYAKAKAHNLLESPFSERQFILLQETFTGLNVEFEKLKMILNDLPLA